MRVAQSKRGFPGLLFGGLLLGLLPACGDDSEGQTCDPTVADSCQQDEVCVLADGDFRCVAECDPSDPDACGDGEACEQLLTGEHACFPAVYIEGRVFDSDTQAGIEGARVMASNEAGVVVTDVAITDAEGHYELAVPVTRDASGTPQEATFTLGVTAQGYQPYPSALRPAIPTVLDAPQQEPDGSWSVHNPTTDVAMLPLPGASGLGSIAGRVEAHLPAGTLVVAEGGQVPAPYAFADTSGRFVLFNVPAGTYSVRGYKAGLQLQPADVDVDAGQEVEDVVLSAVDLPLGSISGQVNIVDAPGHSRTSVVLVPEATYIESLQRGVVPPGLRAPRQGPPSIAGPFTISDVPDGRYVVLAAFENDGLVRDPDPAIAGTQIVHVEVPDGGNRDITLDTAFKVTEALAVVGPGAEEPEPVTGSITFEWADDSSEDYYTIVLFDAFGSEIWKKDHVPRVTGSETVTVTYDGPTLDPGMYYQWRATSWRSTGPISRTEDLRGIFYVATQ